MGFPGWTPEGAVALMDSCGIGTALLSISSPGVLLTGDPADAVVLAREVNDAGAEVVAGTPGRFGLLASLPLPAVAAALEEARRALDELGALGVVLMTNYTGRYLADPAFEPLWAELSRRSAVAVLHPTSPACWEATSPGRPRPMLEFLFDTTRAVVDLVLAGIPARHPGIRWVVPHAGAVLPMVADRVERVWAGVAEASGAAPVEVVAALRGLYYDTAGGPLPRALPALLSLVTPAQLLYGSDYPFTPAGAVTGFTEALRTTDLLDEPSRAAVFSGNARRLFTGLG
jgi:predicted TIM-barrel fold metal-dependent hydrolase